MPAIPFHANEADSETLFPKYSRDTFLMNEREESRGDVHRSVAIMLSRRNCSEGKAGVFFFPSFFLISSGRRRDAFACFVIVSCLVGEIVPGLGKSRMDAIVSHLHRCAEKYDYNTSFERASNIFRMEFGNWFTYGNSRCNKFIAEILDAIAFNVVVESRSPNFSATISLKFSRNAD